MGIRRVVAVTSTIAVAVMAAVVGDLALAVGTVDRVIADPSVARSALGLPEVGPPLPRAVRPKGEVITPPGESGPQAAAPTSYLVVGSDARPGLAGERADVLMLVLVPDRTSQRPALVSLPRDLWVEDLCDGGSQRINAALNGCGEIPGPQLLGATVEHLTGLRVDHYIEIDLAGFESVVEALGGVEVCTAAPVRDRRAGLDLPGGCLQPSPAQTLAWVRARHLEELVDGRWRPVDGASDLMRNQHQQEVVLQLVGRLADLRSPLRARRIVAPLMEHVTLDEELALDELVGDAWAWRRLDPDTVLRPQIEVVGRTTAGGAQVLEAVGDVRQWFAQLLAELNSGAGA